MKKRGGFAGPDIASDIDIDGSGNVYVTGNSIDPTWGSPLFSGCLINWYTFIAQLNSSGSLQWNLFLENSFIPVDQPSDQAITVDGSGMCMPPQPAVASSWA